MYKIIWEKQNLKSEKEESFGEEEGEKLSVPTIHETPLGLFKMDNSMNPYRMMNVYIGHTNFDITNTIMASLNVISGVDCLRVVSRYSFVIGIGKAFDEKSTLALIEQILCKQESLVPEYLSNLSKSIESTTNGWYNSVVLPNGKTIVNQNKDDADEIHLIYELVGGVYSESA